MPQGLSNESDELTRNATELGLGDREGAVFADISRETFRRRNSRSGTKVAVPHREREHGWTKEDIVEYLRSVRAAEGINGVRSGEIQKRHKRVEHAARNHLGSYSNAFKAAFGFPFSRGAFYMAQHMQHLLESGQEVNTVSLSEKDIFKKLIEQGHFDAIYRFVTEQPALRKTSRREVQEAVSRMVLRHLSKPYSRVTPGMEKLFPPRYWEESMHLLEYARSLGLVVPVLVGGVTVYMASDSAVKRAREILLSLDGLEGELDFSLPVWRMSLCEAQSVESETLRYLERTYEGFFDTDKRFVEFYIHQALCNPHNYNPAANAYEPQGSDFRRVAIVRDVVMKYRGEHGIPPELRATLQLLPAGDRRTADTLGRYLLGNVSREVGLERLRNMSVQKDAEAVYRGLSLKPER